MIRKYEVTITRTVYSAVCSTCGAEGPGAVDEHDAHQLAMDEDWEAKAIWPDGEMEGVYKCSDCKLVYFEKSQRKEAKEFLRDHDAQTISSSSSDISTTALYKLDNGDTWEENESRLEEPEYYYTLAKVITKGKDD